MSTPSTPLNLLNDAVNFGVGLFAYSKEQIEKTVENLVDTGKVQRQDAQSFAQKLTEQGKEQRDEIQSMINKTVRTNLEEMGITNQSKPLTAEDVREIVREELAASKKD